MSEPRPNPFMALVVAVATAAFIASPFFADGFRGYQADQFPVPQVDPLIQPPGWSFSIWGVIYLWIGVSAVFGLFLRATAADWAAMRPSLTACLAVGATWLQVAMASPFMGTVLILVMMVAAIVALHDAPFLDHWWARAPVGLLAGWLTAASCVSLGLMLAGYGLMSGHTAAVVCLVLALLIAGFVIWSVRDTGTYALAVAWALLGITLKAMGTDSSVMWLAGFGTVVMAWFALRDIRGVLAPVQPA